MKRLLLCDHAEWKIVLSVRGRSYANGETLLRIECCLFITLWNGCVD